MTAVLTDCDAAEIADLLSLLEDWLLHADDVDGHVIPQGWRHAMPHGVRVWKLLRGGLLGVV